MGRLLPLALALAGALSFPAWAQHAYYENSSHHHVHRPSRGVHAPAGATARCRDSTWSFSEHRRGTCSWHGGVARWL